MGGGSSKPSNENSKREISESDVMSSSVSKVNERDLIAYYEHQLETTGRHTDKHGRALVVDDSKFNRRMLGRTIEGFFNDVDFAENGLEAVNMVRTALEAHNEYSIIFMDSMMPVMGGIEATSQVRGLGFSGMIVGVTGDITVEDNARFLESGVNDVMLKPLLLPHVESILIGKLSIELYLILFFSLIVALSSLFSF
jgi:CheY-like chemotaxis protein